MTTPLITKSLGRDARAPQTRFWERNRFAWSALVFDVLTLSAAAAAVAALSPTSSPTGQVPSEPVEWTLAFSMVVPLLFYLRGMYKAPLRLERLPC